MLIITFALVLEALPPFTDGETKVCRGDTVFMATNSMLTPVVTYTAKNDDNNTNQGQHSV